MKYEGKVYGKVRGKYIELTQTIEDLENEIKSLKEKVICDKDMIIDFLKWKDENDIKNLLPEQLVDFYLEENTITIK